MGGGSLDSTVKFSTLFFYFDFDDFPEINVTVLQHTDSRKMYQQSPRLLMVKCRTGIIKERVSEKERYQAMESEKVLIKN